MLDRPYIEFIQAQMLPWQPVEEGWARAGTQCKILSRDDSTGACTSLIRYPAGWQRTGPEHMAADEEIYVLEGEVEFGEQCFHQDSYAFFPAGFTHERMSSSKGAVILSCFSSRPQMIAGQGVLSEAAEARAVPYLDVLHMPWDMSLNDEKLRHLGISRKDLRKDPVTGERTFLSMILPHSEPEHSRGPQESHPIVEEAYIVSGSLVGPQGEMLPGAYFWRPPQIEHGPFGTRQGTVAFIRFVGGEHVNQWSEHQAPFSFDAPYQPILPDDLMEYAGSYKPPGSAY